MKQTSVYLVTDPHYYDSSFKRSGSAYEARSKTDQKCVAETPAIIDAGFAQIAADTGTEIILIPGDLVYRGEYQSHVGFRDRLYRLKEQGKKIYLITARHDYCEDEQPCEFDGDKMIPVKGMPRAELRDFYKEFGFEEAISEHKESMSYVAQLGEGLRLLALNCDGDCKDFKGLWENQLQWAVDEIRKAHEDGQYIFAMTHYPLLPFSPVMHLVGDAKLTNWEETATRLADAGLDLILTGHMHAQAITEYTTKSGNTITDVQTGCFVGCPCAYRKITFSGNHAEIKSYTIRDFEYDKQGKTAQEYFEWRFHRMIDWQMGELLPKPVQKMLDKFTLKQLGRFLCFRVDKSIENRLAKDVGIELVRNVFIGNEPYVKGTPIYEAMEKLLKRLHPITHILEKKLGSKNAVLSDIDAFILSMIGDERQRDYETTLTIKST
ncbi:MAG TPA: metallophosphoesterase [Candidatus Fimivicinus intestinavium]|nr:metallophosphoesterase [Candidatus Fimivicinus intestinavium]